MLCDDLIWMQRALTLGERGRGHVEPNPLVGAVLVRAGHMMGEGWHQRFGEAHAETQALAAAGEGARGATMYVTLEPCCHQGKTPPCTRALIEAGVVRVVAAMADPFPQVAGQGVSQLRQAGVTVEVGLGEDLARRLNAPYLKLLATGQPYVHAKWAMTLDGKIASRSGDSRWISNAAARRRVHELRGRMDAIVVGVGTVLADDPLLTARPPGPRTACRIVLDSHGRLPLTSRLVQTARQMPTLVVAHAESALDLTQLQAAGCDTLALPGEGGRPDVLLLLDELGRRRFTNVLVEGGGDVLGSFRDAGAIDEVHVFIAPKIMGGAAARMPFSGQGADRLAQAWQLTRMDAEFLEGDIYVHGWR